MTALKQFSIGSKKDQIWKLDRHMESEILGIASCVASAHAKFSSKDWKIIIEGGFQSIIGKKCLIFLQPDTTA